MWNSDLSKRQDLTKAVFKEILFLAEITVATFGYSVHPS